MNHGAQIFELRRELREALHEEARLRALAEYEDAREAQRDAEMLRRQIAELEALTK